MSCHLQYFSRNCLNEMDAELTNSISSICQPQNQTSTIQLCASRSELEEQLSLSEALRKKLRFIITHIIFRLFGLILILVDITIVILDLTLVANDSQQILIGLDWTAFILICYFLVEVNLRLIALGLREFVRLWFNIVDYVIVVVSFGISLFSVLVNDDHFSDYAKLVVVGRLVRVAVFVRLFTERKYLEAGVRNLVSQNKRRYVKDGFDLDLTYVTDTVIAMSFPSSGKMAMYRNPIKEVARFLDKMHPNNYKVYNLCSEKAYDGKHFHDRVERFPFDDHNPPPLSEMFRFTRNVGEWLSIDPRRVVVIHCKGGKGRTGTMISAWLIESEKFDSIKDCLGYFGNRRTNFELGDKYQGVETPSQNRYVAYYGHVKNRYQGQKPLDKTLQLDRLEIFSIKNLGKGNGSDLTLEVQDGDKHCLLWTDFSRSDPKKDVCLKQDNDCLCVAFKDGPLLQKDVKMIFHTTSKTVPRMDKDIAFFFWFHVAFIEDLSLVLRRQEIDNAHKRKTWNHFNEKFEVKLTFKEVTDL